MIDFAELHQNAEARDWAAAKDAPSFGVTGLYVADFQNGMTHWVVRRK